MKCLRSGFCCINYDVIIVSNPELGIVQDNLEHKPTGQPCKHLKGEIPGQYICSIHHYDWYKETPCFDYGQIEDHESNCRTGEYFLKKHHK